MNISIDFADHWKLNELKHKIGDIACEVIIRLWISCQRRRSISFREETAPHDIARVCRYKEDPNKLLEALLACGLLDKRDGSYEVHEWAYYNRTVTNSWENGKKGGRPKKDRVMNPEEFVP